MVLKLYSYPNNVRVERAKICALYVGVELEEVITKMPLEESLLKINPFGRVPFLETENGEGVFESNAILYYIAGLSPAAGALGRSYIEQARVMQWLSICESDLMTVAMPLLGYKMNPTKFKFNANEEKEASTKLHRILNFMNSHLESHTYLASERVTAADMCMIPNLKKYLTLVVSESGRSQLPNLMRYFNTCMGKAHFASVLGEVSYPEKTVLEQYKEEQAAAKAANKAAKAAEKAPAKAKPVEEKPAEKPVPEKKKHPLDLLPPTSMPLDEWKRQYANNDTRSVALPWLWENIDMDGYTFWYCKYKYNHELEKTFMAANLITGWFQRIESIGKYLFGNVLVFGKSGEGVEISGAWLIRGSMNPMDEDMMGTLDAECYEWRKMDMSDPKDKALFEDYCAHDGKFEGGATLEFNQGKTFKGK